MEKSFFVGSGQKVYFGKTLELSKIGVCVEAGKNPSQTLVPIFWPVVNIVILNFGGGCSSSSSSCQTPVLVLRLGVDFVLPLSQQQEQQEQQEEPPPNISAVTDPILTKL